MNSSKLQQTGLFATLPDEQRNWLIRVADSWPLSFQQLKMLTEYCVDMICWDAGSPEQYYRPEKLQNVTGKKGAALFFRQIKKGYESLVNQPKKYDACTAQQTAEILFPKKRIKQTQFTGNLMGSCPVASLRTRCCNLYTLDAVQQCGFHCSYCSIQSFYHGNQVRFIKNLVQHLDTLQLDPHKTYHIGTGQSSDSLMWGNSHGLLDALCDFAGRHPNVILEMKSKSGRIDYFLENQPPPNMIFTWSLNPPVVIHHEEQGCASLDIRLESARKLADRGSPVGFHLHPIIWYQGWQRDYTDLVARLTDSFTPDETVMVSFGTLTFIKSVIKRIRRNMIKSSILQMPMEDIGGKLSYPFEIKKDMFTTAYNAFPRSWKDGVFFYLCMEDTRLWRPVLHRSYDSNEEFEAAMVANYTEKIRRIEAKKS